MNFNGYNFDSAVRSTLSELDSRASLPHALIIECGDTEKSAELCEFLCMYLMCSENDRPCARCPQCHRAKERIHADISVPEPENKSGTYSIEQVRDMIKTASVKPNEAKARIFVLEKADERFSTVVQNAFLKLLEEPPGNVYFILQCKNSRALLPTVLSRCSVIRISGGEIIDEKCVDYAESIIKGILAAGEYELLKATMCFSDAERSTQTAAAVMKILRDALVLHAGAKPDGLSPLAAQLVNRFTKQTITELMELTQTLTYKLRQNVNINLFATWLCGEYRRISWQR